MGGEILRKVEIGEAKERRAWEVLNILGNVNNNPGGNGVDALRMGGGSRGRR